MYLKNVLKNSINFYRNYLSQLTLRKCRYYPSCSEYTLEAIEHKGAFQGLLKGALRILRCNPLFPGGYDPVRKPKTENREDKDGKTIVNSSGAFDSSDAGVSFVHGKDQPATH
ncbi:MAG: membrane protein insertion efficiency factor YidD [Candidatus Omnitrophica bacterium]|nr:membrane protein insertion efficiency factor YidD [Candidatus Omnitrophota bacterium]